MGWTDWFILNTPYNCHYWVSQMCVSPLKASPCSERNFTVATTLFNTSIQYWHSVSNCWRSPKSIYLFSMILLTHTIIFLRWASEPSSSWTRSLACFQSLKPQLANFEALSPFPNKRQTKQNAQPVDREYSSQLRGTISPLTRFLLNKPFEKLLFWCFYCCSDAEKSASRFWHWIGPFLIQ